MSVPENTSINTHATVEDLLLGPSVTASRAARRPGRVLDIPCGAGAFCDRIEKKGIESYPADIEDILQVENSRFSKADMNKPLPWADGFFDAVVCIDGIEHLERPFDFIRECGRVLGEKGMLIISTPNISALRSRWRFLLTGHHNKCKTPLDETAPTPLHHVSMLSFPDMRYMLHSNGFSIKEVATNRIKPASWIYAPLAPLAMWATAMSYRRHEKDPGQKTRNREIMRQACSPAVLFGETLILKAEKS